MQYHFKITDQLIMKINNIGTRPSYSTVDFVHDMSRHNLILTNFYKKYNNNLTML